MSLFYCNFQVSSVHCCSFKRNPTFLLQSEDAVRRFKGEIECVVGNILHTKQPWFHGIIPREEADRRLNSQNCKDGLFLIRERGNPKRTYVLGICSNNKIYHYLFERNPQDQLSIKSGRPFDNLMAVVNFYSQKSEGLLCKLQNPCDVALFEFHPKFEKNKNILLHPDIQKQLRWSLSQNESELKAFRRLSRQGTQIFFCDYYHILVFLCVFLCVFKFFF